METGQSKNSFLFVSVLESTGWHPLDKAKIWRFKVFGNKKSKQERLFSIGHLVRGARNGISPAELARKLNVSRSTITKDLGIVERETDAQFWEDDDGRLHWFE